MAYSSSDLIQVYRWLKILQLFDKMVFTPFYMSKSSLQALSCACCTPPTWKHFEFIANYVTTIDVMTRLH